MITLILKLFDGVSLQVAERYANISLSVQICTCKYKFFLKEGVILPQQINQKTAVTIFLGNINAKHSLICDVQLYSIYVFLGSV